MMFQEAMDFESSNQHLLTQNTVRRHTCTHTCQCAERRAQEQGRKAVAQKQQWDTQVATKSAGLLKDRMARTSPRHASSRRAGAVRATDGQSGLAADHERDPAQQRPQGASQA